MGDLIVLNVRKNILTQVGQILKELTEQGFEFPVLWVQTDANECIQVYRIKISPKTNEFDLDIMCDQIPDDHYTLPLIFFFVSASGEVARLVVRKFGEWPALEYLIAEKGLDKPSKRA